MKKFAAVLVTLLIVLAVSGVAAAESGKCGENLTWTLEDTGLLTISGTGDMDDYPVSSDKRSPWYDHRKSVEAVVIENGVEGIGASAFRNCTNLTRVVLPQTLRHIGEDAFYYCVSLAAIDLPENLQSIGEGALSYCHSLKMIRIPKATTSIGEEIAGVSGVESIIFEGISVIPKKSFVNSFSLKEIVLPKTVTRIEDWAFDACDSLERVYYSGTEAQREKIVIVGDRQKQMFDSLQWICCTAEGSCGTNLHWQLFGRTRLVISGTGSMKNYSAAAPAPWAAYAPEITEVILSDNMESIGAYAFSDCSNLEYVSTSYDFQGRKGAYLPEGLTEIGAAAFKGCSSLVNIFLPKDVDKIGTAAFMGCSFITSISLPEDIIEIDEAVFAGCSSLRRVDIPENVTTIGMSAFNGCSALETIVLPESVWFIGRHAFESCSKLEQIVLAEGNEVLCEGTFEGCSALKAVTLPLSLVSIEENAFRGSALQKVYYRGTAQQREQIEIGAGNEQLSDAEWICIAKGGVCGEELTWALDEEWTLTFSGHGRMDDYSQSRVSPWAAYAAQVKTLVIGEGVESLGDYSLAGCGELTELPLPEGMTQIGNHALQGCGKVTQIFIPASLTHVDAQVLSDLTGLQTIQVDEDNPVYYEKYHYLFERETDVLIKGTNVGVFWLDGVYEFGDYAFAGCTGIGGFGLTREVKRIGDHAFEGCTGLTEFKQAWGTMERIGDYAFSGCTNLETLGMNRKRVTSIGTRAFENCRALTWVELTDTQSMGAYAFAGCTALETVTLPSTLKTISRGAFSGCTGLQSISLPEGVESIEPYAFSRSGVQHISLPKTLTGIENQAFAESSLQEIEIPDSVTAIGLHAFDSCGSLTKVTLPGSITTIAEGAFQYCTELREVDIADGITGIAKDAFWHCPSLEHLVLPGSMAEIKPEAFGQCERLKTVDFWGTPAQMKTITMGKNNEALVNADWNFRGTCGDDLLWTLEVRKDHGLLRITGTGRMMEYTSADAAPWASAERINEVVIGADVESISAYAFAGCAALQKVTVNGMKTAYEGDVFDTPLTICCYRGSTAAAFAKANNLRIEYLDAGTAILKLPSGLETIGSEAFVGISAAEVIIPDGVICISSRAFAVCCSLEYVFIPDSVTDIAEDAFEGSTGFTIICSDDSTAAAFANHMLLPHRTTR